MIVGIVQGREALIRLTIRGLRGCAQRLATSLRQEP